jgi:hypothetical protein
MQQSNWSEDDVVKALEKSGKHTFRLSNKSRAKVAQALVQENTRLTSQKTEQKQRRGLSRVLASLSHH